jgi:hypothetical protein
MDRTDAVYQSQTLPQRFKERNHSHAPAHVNNLVNEEEDFFATASG